MHTVCCQIRRAVIPTGICLALLVLTGCSQTMYGAANITSSPEGAAIVNLRDNSQIGTTPARVVWKGEEGTAEQVTLQLRKQGYIDKISTIWINHRHRSEAEAKANAVDITVELEKQ
ncbi:hypothetical protein JWG42_13455 [Desulfoprunum benzoelyticum]|uniref:PEGA domain-containing protein n=1 Tax=Desulfoprunum benzoelyticum TaxID=1506996 RepID=A0A840UKG6_9BACT|nr:hypothetical protein [Desulfoprunum benzoelyticum]MBB5346827.1 hypothetical protein [Desulfoprunum benzoelyticum]MBM9531160.1 hypothetical protein [Desulfoprunum benzoelyticum]